MGSLKGIVDFNQRTRDEWVAGIAGGLPAGAKVLDAGAGECRYKELFAHCDYRTHDFCKYEGTPEGPLTDRWDYGRIDYVGDVASIPVADGEFDAVLCTEVLEHVPEPIRALKEFGRVVRPGGGLFLSAPLGSGLHQEPYHYYGGFTPHFYRTFLPRFGFEVVSIEPNGGFYRHLLQELWRARGFSKKHLRAGRLSPRYWRLRLAFGRKVMRQLADLDDRFPIDLFTVGFHVEAKRLDGAATGGEPSDPGEGSSC